MLMRRLGGQWPYHPPHGEGSRDGARAADVTGWLLVAPPLTHTRGRSPCPQGWSPAAGASPALPMSRGLWRWRHGRWGTARARLRSGVGGQRRLGVAARGGHAWGSLGSRPPLEPHPRLGQTLSPGLSPTLGGWSGRGLRAVSPRQRDSWGGGGAPDNARVGPSAGRSCEGARDRPS